ncbi:hypothetical protein FGADI_2 [Fusarium gaditjirri]|uniref:Uncharacterized protein n=1 Tax=Fusarium gaditjirri TaxID=282569 RepID=A0A8H4X5E4_9HYPO|nr:hypothetical protein FGADI_2 [Fusarium gaditjirri]
MSESDQNQNVPHPGQHPARVRQWMSPRDPSYVSGILMLLNNQEILAEQLSKLTEIVSDVKIGSRSSSKSSSRRSSDVSSRRSSRGKACGQEQPSDAEMDDYDDSITWSFVNDDDFYHIIERYIQNSGITPNVKRIKCVLDNANKFREAAEAQLLIFGISQL